MKLPSDAVLKRAWMAGATGYAKPGKVWNANRKSFLKRLRAIARVILEAQGKGKKGK